ncbi:flagellar motor protein [Caldanaerobius polysaccharolyticus]|uniref:flagellar motor protein n=1 Tax=Caldanaerobius polysaccharolyticus TaxID=44256 RepID=UPI0005519E28|nr:flagellar motor protein [Caldanaerobius polysaccharolyticus]
MDVSTLLGMAIGFGSLILAFVLEGGKVGSLVVGSAALIVFGGTIGAVMTSYKFKDFIKIPGLLIKSFTDRNVDISSLIETIVSLAKKARQEGLLSLEEELNRGDLNDFLKRGLTFVIDGLDVNLIKDMMELDMYIFEQRAKKEINIFQSAGGYAPTMGIIGTVMGLVNVLSNLSNPQELGPSIAVAFIATLYGVSSANLFWLPIAEKLKQRAESDRTVRELIIEGILSIQQGENPKIIEEKLISFLEKKEKNAHNVVPELSENI